MQAGPFPCEMLDLLVVDDIESSRLVLGRALEQLGHRVRLAADGESALQLIQRDPPDVVFLDLLMPGMDGFEVTRRIRAIERQDRWMPVIVCSSMQGDEHFGQALQHGADDYLVRPVNPKLLVAKLSHMAWLLHLQQELRATAQRQRDIHDHISDPVLTLDAQGRVLDANLAACQRFSLGSPAGLVACRSEDVMGAPLARLVEGGEMVLRDARGEQFPAEVRSSTWQEGGGTRYTMVLRDLSEQRALTRAKDEFMAAVSHELRTPLTAIHGAVSLLEAGRGGELAPKARQLVDMASRNARRLSRLIDDVFDLTQLEGERMAVRCEAQEVGPLLQEALSANQGVVVGQGLSLVGQWRESDLAAQVSIDADRLGQVLANLISNAAKYSPPQGQIRLGLEVGPQRVRLSVSDQGPGIPPEFRARLFEKFSRAEPTANKTKQGLGLGLYIARLLVERMGGTLSLGTPKHGCEMWVDLPPVGQGLRQPLWLVDADPERAARTARMLGADWRVQLAAQPARLDRSSGLPQAVLVDPQGQDAADALFEQLRVLAPGVPVLVFSDAVDERYAHSEGLAFLPREGSTAGDLELALRRLHRHETIWQDL
ncbi:response regulator [Mitsuaria sp. WAJ17]|uniref:hybrid sensor histidine kinase/response regulator n=1 Tax=Mitsuaria sp. WAJ17 TaxID=2761452 RepID=UPI00160148D1|nr:ATP-binding protein [Mitsuaria sp. WAJ17]MBB2487049.1 response regulator [Mitsuaria sp. WAJ17]